VTGTKAIGDIGGGTRRVGLVVGPVKVSDPNAGIALNYLIMNSGNANSDLLKALASVGNALARDGAAVATKAIGGAIGLGVGSTVLPVIGSVLGQIGCDGVVAAEQVAMKGIDLWMRTLAGPFTLQTYHFASDSPWGCGDNAQYVVEWTINRANPRPAVSR
jgi:hypothetical protein